MVFPTEVQFSLYVSSFCLSHASELFFFPEYFFPQDISRKLAEKFTLGNPLLGRRNITAASCYLELQKNMRAIRIMTMVFNCRDEILLHS